MARGKFVLLALAVILVTFTVGTVLSYATDVAFKEWFDGAICSFGSAFKDVSTTSIVVAVCGIVGGMAIAVYEGTYVKFKHYKAKNNVDVPFDKRYLISAGITAVICALTIGLCWMNGWIHIEQGVAPQIDINSVETFLSSLVGTLKPYVPLLETVIAVLSQGLILIRAINANVALYIKEQENFKKEIYNS